MVAGYNILQEQRQPIKVEGGEIECVEDIQYLQALVQQLDNGSLDAEIDKRISSTLKAFGALKQAVFMDDNLSVAAKQKVYQACVLSVLLYGGESWTPLKRHIKRLDVFIIGVYALCWV